MQETADNSNRLKNSLPKDNQVKQENIKIHGIGLDKAGRKKLILFYAETAAGNLHFRNTKKAVALTATQDLIQNAVYMRIFISVALCNVF